MKKQNSAKRKSIGLKLALTATTSLAALLATPVMAQDAPADEAETPAADIVVTGSLLRRSGMDTPQPVTAVTSDELQAMSPGNLVEGITQLPQFFNSLTPNAPVSWFTRGGNGNLDMRGIGPNRTLTLLNGRRVISSTIYGGVDVTAFPQSLIKSVETVTGGASAAYGTDAVAGVTNFKLDTDFTGLRASLQGGMTTRSDSKNYQASVAFGMKLGERGHVLLSYERFQQDGVHNYQGRDWYKAWGTVADATQGGRLVRVPNVVTRSATLDGLIFSPNALLNGIAFKPDGSTYTFANSSLFAGNTGTAGARQSITNGGSGDDMGAELTTLYPDFKRDSAFAYADYELTDSLKVFAQYIRGHNHSFRYNTPGGSLQGVPTGITIFADNAYLPASIKNIMTANNIASFNLRRMGSLADWRGKMTLEDDSTMNSATAGFTYDVDSDGFLGGWQFDGYYQYGTSYRKGYQVGLRVDRIFAAVDAVYDANNKIVCRTSLPQFAGTTANPNPFSGCVPINLFGRNNASAAGVDWVTGFDVGQQINTPLYFSDDGFASGATDSYTAIEAKQTLTRMRQHVASFTANGDVADLFGAGPMKLAVGGSWRRESVRQIVRDSTNRSSNHNVLGTQIGHPVLCGNEVITPGVTSAQLWGIRGVSQPDCGNTVGVQFSKVSNTKGMIQVSEAFSEFEIPVLRDSKLGQDLTLTGAGRYAHYTLSGGVWAWKFGAEYAPAEGLRFRVTRSRDVRAANLAERYDRTGGSASVTDPFSTTPNTPVTVTTYTGGNPAVLPERADTLTIGAVAKPGIIPGMSISLDYYRIKIADMISQLTPQQVLNSCFAGAADICTLISRNPDNSLLLVGAAAVNVNEAVIRGVDMEVGYQTGLRLFGGDESLSARGFASWLFENSQFLAGSAKINRAGQTGIEQSTGTAYALPKFKYTGNLTYSNGPFSLFLQARYIAPGKMENSPPNVATTLVNNRVASAFYMDTRIGYKLEVAGSEVELFGSVTNLFDRDPPLTPYWTNLSAATTQHNAALFDVLGRRFVVGVKFAM